MALAREFANDAANLVRQEIGLARAELRQNVRDLVTHVGELAVGGSVALIGLLVLVAFLVVGLGVLLGGAYWLSSLIVALVLLGGGAGLGYLGVRRLGSRPLVPTATIESLKGTTGWAAKEAGDLRAVLSAGGGASPPSTLTDRQHRKSGSIRPSAERAAPAQTPTAGHKAERPPLSTPFHKRIIQEIGDDDVLGKGAQVAFFMFTSLPPALLVIFSLTGLFGGEAVGEFLASRLQDALPGSGDDPESAAGFISQFVDQIVHENAPGPLSVGLLFGLWASSAVFVALMDALNRAYDLDDDRSWFRRRAIAIGVMFGFALLFLSGSVVLIAGPTIARSIELGGVVDVLWSILQWPLAFLLVVIAFFIVYYVLPNRDQSRQKAALAKGSAIAAGIWLLATLGFRLYISNFGSYSETYGFVGAILVLLLWMYITGVVILIGGEISSEMEREARA